MKRQSTVIYWLAGSKNSYKLTKTVIGPRYPTSLHRFLASRYLLPACKNPSVPRFLLAMHVEPEGFLGRPFLGIPLKALIIRGTTSVSRLIHLAIFRQIAILASFTPHPVYLMKHLPILWRLQQDRPCPQVHGALPSSQYVNQLGWQLLERWVGEALKGFVAILKEH